MELAFHDTSDLSPPQRAQDDGLQGSVWATAKSLTTNRPVNESNARFPYW
jgi:hypothetical protein